MASCASESKPSHNSQHVWITKGILFPFDNFSAVLTVSFGIFHSKLQANQIDHRLIVVLNYKKNNNDKERKKIKKKKYEDCFETFYNF